MLLIMGISREDLEQDRLRTSLLHTPVAATLLTDAALEASWRAALKEIRCSQQASKDVWLFAYGSLIWNPMVAFTERCRGMLYGYHRGFYLYSRINRGTWDNPGLVLGLDRGGSCQGVLLRIPAKNIESELHVLWRREMMTGAYIPRWLPVRPKPQGANKSAPETVHALAFVMNRKHYGYAGRLPDTTVVRHLRNACGAYGPARDYLRNTLLGLEDELLHDPYLKRLWSQLENLDEDALHTNGSENI
jgi:cation transport protein ChaC